MFFEFIYFDFCYCVIDLSGIVENEVCLVFVVCIISVLQINDDEVMDY